MSDTMTQPATLGEMLRGFSMELSPKEMKVIDAAAEQLDRGTNVYLTWIPGEDPFLAVPAAVALRRGGMVPVPHIGARHVESEAQLAEFVARLSGEAGVDRVLVLAGDREKPAGPYDWSLPVMESGILQRNGITKIAISGFPEGNPNIPEPLLSNSLAAKVEFGRRAGFDLTIVTQFCFEVPPIMHWLNTLRASGNDVPVRIGVAGPASIVTLTRYAMKCGVGASLRALTHNPSFSRLLTEKGPEPIIRELGAQLSLNGNLSVQGIHFFVFGGFKKTVEWIKASRTS